MRPLQKSIPRTIVPTQDDSPVARESRRQLSRVLKRKSSKPVQFQIESQDRRVQSLSIPASAVRLLDHILGEMAEGHAVTLMPVKVELTTQQAAELLHLSRPFLIDLLEKKLIPHRKAGTHRRILFEDVMEYKKRVDDKRLKVLEELATQAQELGMGY